MDVFSEVGPLRTCAGTTVTMMRPVPARQLLAPVDEESAPMEDGERGKDESMQEAGREEDNVQEARRKCRSTRRLTSLTALGALIASEEGREKIPKGQEEEGEDQVIISTLRN